MSKTVVHKNESEKLFLADKEAFLDNSLSMSSKGVLATILAMRNESQPNVHFNLIGYDSEFEELRSKGYLLNEYFENGNINTISSKKLNKGKKKGNYKRILSEALGIRWNTDVLCVHHLNHNHGDNALHNLLLMPKRMHNKYHLLRHICEDGFSNILSYGSEGMSSDFDKTVRSFMDVKRDMDRLYFNQQYAIEAKKKDYSFNSAEYLYNSCHSITNKYC